MNWFSKHKTRIDPDDLFRKADESLKTTREQQERINVVTSYLERRKNQNGFGEDFEYTLRPRGAH